MPDINLKEAEIAVPAIFLKCKIEPLGIPNASTPPVIPVVVLKKLFLKLNVYASNLAFCCFPEGGTVVLIFEGYADIE